MKDSKLSVFVVDDADPLSPNLCEQIAACGAEVRQTGPSLSSKEILEQALGLGPPGLLVLSSSSSFSARESFAQLLEKSAGMLPVAAIGAACDLLAATFKGRVGLEKGRPGRVPIEVRHERKGILIGVPSPFIAAVYTPTLLRAAPPKMIARATSERGIMLIEHERYPMLGIRFRPDSVVTREGPAVVSALLDWAASSDPRLVK